MISIDDAANELHRIVYVEGKRQSPARLDTLADFCVQELESRGLTGAEKEGRIPGFGRTKSGMWCGDTTARSGSPYR